jgi:hypothetical protein
MITFILFSYLAMSAGGLCVFIFAVFCDPVWFEDESGYVRIREARDWDQSVASAGPQNREEAIFDRF